MLEAAHSVQEHLRTLDKVLTELKGGSLRLGAVSTVKYFAPRLIAGFKQRNPEIQINLFIGNCAETIEALCKQTVNVALMGRSPADLKVNAAVSGVIRL